MKRREHGALLHNMSAPPKTVIRYAGLTRLDTEADADDAAAARDRGLHGTALRVALPQNMDTTTPAAILRALGMACGGDPAGQLAAAINQRAAHLPLPDGCVVVPSDADHRMPWPDALAALAVLCKASDHVWLRAKTPSVHGPFARRHASLLVPPGFITAPEEDCP